MMPLPQTDLLPDDASALHELFARIERVARQLGLSQGPLLRAQLVGEELLVNSRQHAGAHCWCAVVAEQDALLLLYEDDGPAYDPLQAVAEHLCWELERRPVGGIGQPLIQGLPCAVEYQRQNARNRILAVFRDTPKPAEPSASA